MSTMILVTSPVFAEQAAPRRQRCTGEAVSAERRRIQQTDGTGSGKYENDAGANG